MHTNAVLRSADARRQREVRQLILVFGEVCDSAAAAGGPISPYHHTAPPPHYNQRRRCGMRGCMEQRRRSAGRPYPRPGSLMNIVGLPRRRAYFLPAPDLASRLDCPPIHEMVVPLLMLISDIEFDK